MTRKAIYQSRYSPGKSVTIFHLIIEVICENSAKKNGKTLPTFFWKLKEWEKFYKMQLRRTSELCKKHGDEKVLDFVKKKNIYSVLAKHIDDWLTEYKFEPKKVEPVKIDLPNGKINKVRKIKRFEGLE